MRTLPAHARCSLKASSLAIAIAAVFMLPSVPAYAQDGSNDQVKSLDAVNVEGSKVKPQYETNADIQRTVDDAQPYYIFNAETIEKSGVANVEEFLRQRLTMNSVRQSYSQTDSVSSSSQVNLRGLGQDKTLILINGRRAPGVLNYSDSLQTDLNGIPLSAIDRIEVLPASSSGIYGGSAIGGVVNVILKKDYSGGEVKISYENTFNTDTALPSVNLSYGGTLGDSGRTRYMLSAAYSDGNALLNRDRYDVVVGNINKILQNHPTYFHSGTNPYLGATPNISSANGSNLVLKDGRSLGSSITHISPGTGLNTPYDQLAAQLLGNAGSYNMTLSNSSQQTGNTLGRMLSKTPEIKSFMGTLQHQISDRVEVFADLYYSTNESRTVINQLGSWYQTVAANSPTNPFTEAVNVRWPNSLQPEIYTYDKNRRATFGLNAELANDWTLSTDFSYTQSHHLSTWRGRDYTGLGNALNNGDYNPFVDTYANTQNLAFYMHIVTLPPRKGTTQDFAVRAAGPLFDLPWGTVNLATGLEYIKYKEGKATGYAIDPASPQLSESFTWFEQNRDVSSLYAEATIPLARPQSARFLDSLELQLAVRAERFEVDTGTYRDTCRIMVEPVTCFYTPADANGQPYQATAKYNKTSPTVALKYQPSKSLMLRASYSEAFLPPTFNQLLPNAVVNGNLTRIVDYANGGLEYDIQTISGGNLNVQPLTAKSYNAGFVWTPQSGALEGLRFGLEYFRIRQDNVIGSLSAQYILNDEATFSDRVTRDPVTGLVTLINTSQMNLTRYETSGLDLSTGYAMTTDGYGTFGADVMLTYVDSEKRQLAVDGPMLDYAGYASEGGPLKYKANLNLFWAKGNWLVNWSTRYFDSYYQYGAKGGPYSLRFDATNGPYVYYTASQGSDTVPSQTYHDVMATYDFSDRGGMWQDLSLQLGIKNVLDKVPPLDSYNYYGYVSPLGDLRLRSYLISIKKKF